MNILKKLKKIFSRPKRELWNITLTPVTDVDELVKERCWVLDPALAFFNISPLKLYLEGLSSQVDKLLYVKPVVGRVDKLYRDKSLITVCYPEVPYVVPYTLPGVTIEGITPVTKLYKINVTIK